MSKAETANSYYRATALPRSVNAPLVGETTTDVCVIGGGYTGISAALELRRRGYGVVVLEAAEIGAGASGLNGGQLGGGMRRDIDWLEDKLGRDVAGQLWQIGNEARSLVQRAVSEYSIECDLKPGVVFGVHRKSDLTRVHTLADKLVRDYGAKRLEKLDARGIADVLGTNAYHGGWLDGEASHLHPLNLLLGEARAAEAAGVRIFEGSRAVGYDDGEPIRVRTSSGQVLASFLVHAMNAYLGGFEPRIAGRIMPVNNYIVATGRLPAAVHKRLNPRDVAAADSRFVISYFRWSADNRLLFGGGESYTHRFPKDIGAFVRPHLLRVYPELEHTPIDYAWGGRLAITLNRMPHLGRLSPRVYFAQGYSGHGIGMAHMAGLLIAQSIAGTAERFDLFAQVPIHTFPGGRWLRWPALALGMTYFALRDRL